MEWVAYCDNEECVTTGMCAFPIAKWNKRADTAPALSKRVEELERALQEIAKGEGAFNRDPLKHAENVIEHMRSVAERALLSPAEPEAKKAIDQ